MNLLQTIILAIVQGVSELFPISSVAHSVLVPYILGWNLSPTFLKENFLQVVVMMHLGTTIALLLYFRNDWIEIIGSLFKKGARKELMLVIFGTVPAVILGFAFEHSIKENFSNVNSAAFFLIVNGILLIVGQYLRPKGTKKLSELSLGQGFIVGLFQALALIPGFSRSGSSMTAGFIMGLSNEESARFSMLLATPIIAGASILEIPKLIHTRTSGILGYSLIGGVVAGFFAFLSVYLLMHWFKKREINIMWPFAVYCMLVGAIILVANFF